MSSTQLNMGSKYRPYLLVMFQPKPDVDTKQCLRELLGFDCTVGLGWVGLGWVTWVGMGVNLSELGWAGVKMDPRPTLC